MENIMKDSPDSKFFIDTEPENYKYVGLILQALPMAIIIYCHRDPMDNCLFMYFHFYRKDLTNVASYYIACNDLMAHWQQLYGDRILGVRYEDLVRNPADVGARIYAFCGLDYDPKRVRSAFTTDEIGHWKCYEPYLGALHRAFGDTASNPR